MNPRPTTLLWSAVDGVECRMAPSEDDRYQLMLRWNAETIKAAVVTDYGRALALSREWRLEQDRDVAAPRSVELEEFIVDPTDFVRRQRDRLT